MLLQTALKLPLFENFLPPQCDRACGGPEACNFIKKETPTKVFSCKFCEIFKNTFFTEHFTTASSFCNSSHSFILQRSFIYLFKPFFVRKIDKNSQFCHLFILQIHFILCIGNVFYKSKHKHKKSCFVNEIVELYL